MVTKGLGCIKIGLLGRKRVEMVACLFECNREGTPGERDRLIYIWGNWEWKWNSFKGLYGVGGQV